MTIEAALADTAFKKLLDTLADLLKEKIYFLREVGDHLKSLDKELRWMIESFLIAEKVVKSDTRLKNWVDQFREIIYEAEDVVEEFNLKNANYKRRLNHTKYMFAQFFSLHDIGVRIKKINATANELNLNMQHYGAVIAQATSSGAESSNSGVSLHHKINKRRVVIFEERYEQEYNVSIHEGVVGQVMPLLARGEGALCVISISGMGGVGKTTLSKKLYNLGNGFDCRALVHISNACSSPDKLLESIMKQCFGSLSDEPLEVTDNKLYEGLLEKKYLILLDDVWDTDVWFRLKNWFPNNKKGSIVLLTTRHKEVANSASFLPPNCSLPSTNIHELDVINEMESWQIFQKWFHPDRHFGLEDLGKKMVKKCSGLPLAIRVLVDLLKGKSVGKNAWSAVNASASWLSSEHEDSYKCPGILALSYDYMPYYLKQCFLYTSLFPQDCDISATKLYQYWIAEGLVSSTGEETLESTAEGYMGDLISRNLIKVSRFSYDGKVKNYRTHDLIRDISLVESQNVKFSQIFGSIDKLYKKKVESAKNLRVSVYCDSDAVNNKQGFPRSFHTNIRFLMCRNTRFEEYNFSSFFGGFKSLRVLEFFENNQGRTSLPKEIGELIHLRYLSFEKTKLEKIDTSYLSKLVNLQTLNLNGCLDELVLDDKIWSFRKLRHLYLKSIRPTSNNSTVDKLGIGDLENLHLLHIQDGDWVNDGGLGKLSSLRKLKIEECFHLKEISIAVAKLTNLESLALISKTSIKEPVTNPEIPLATIQLSNHTSLVSLNLKGRILDNWPTDIISFQPNICKLKLEWSWIPEDPMKILEKLPRLRFLHLGFESYTGMQMECSAGGFVALQTLEIVSLLTLRRWIIQEGALASLTKLEILDCEKLKKIPDGLRYLTKLEELTERLPHLHKRMEGSVGKDWHKIKHIPSRVTIA